MEFLRKIKLYDLCLGFVFHVTLHFSQKSCCELHLGHPLLHKFLYTLMDTVCKVTFLKNLPIRTLKNWVNTKQ